jgi:hypothetical protein
MSYALKSIKRSVLVKIVYKRIPSRLAGNYHRYVTIFRICTPVQRQGKSLFFLQHERHFSISNTST